MSLCHFSIDAVILYENVSWKGAEFQNTTEETTGGFNNNNNNNNNMYLYSAASVNVQ